MNEDQVQLISYEKALEDLTALIIDPELEELETQLDPFNIFEAIGVRRQELRHSDFLAFLLNPRQNHGLGDVFLKRFLQKALLDAPGTMTLITPIDIDVWSFDDVLVLREHLNIDILLLDEPHEMAVIIENKIGIGEHSGQLARYRRNITEHYPHISNIVGLYLTPGGSEPLSEAEYQAVSYGLVAELLEELTTSRASTLGPDVLTLIKHYVQMLRRHVVENSKTAELCRRIYQKHQSALDLIYEYRPDQQEDVRNMLEALIKKTPGLELDHSSKSYIRFVVSEWDVPLLLSGKGWTRSGRILLFEFANSSDQLKLRLTIGPGPSEVRELLFQMALRKEPPFKLSYKARHLKWDQIYGYSFLKAKDYDGASLEEIEQKIWKQWTIFVEQELPALITTLNEEAWIWSTNSDAVHLISNP